MHDGAVTRHTDLRLDPRRGTHADEILAPTMPIGTSKSISDGTSVPVPAGVIDPTEQAQVGARSTRAGC